MSAERLAALPKLGMLEAAALQVFFIIFIAISAVMTAKFLANFPLAAIVPAGFVAIGVLMLIKLIREAKEKTSKVMLARAAIVVSKHTEVSGGGNSAVRTEYCVTFEFEDGQREEFTCAATCIRNSPSATPASSSPAPAGRRLSTEFAEVCEPRFSNAIPQHASCACIRLRALPFLTPFGFMKRTSLTPFSCILSGHRLIYRRLD